MQTEQKKLLTEKEVAVILGVSVSWCQRMRWRGGGPPFFKIGSAIRYRLDDLEVFIESRRMTSTSQQSPSIE